MKHRRAATAYAKALFAVAKEQGCAEVVSRELGEVTATFEQDEKLRDLFARPWIAPSTRRAVATEIAERSHLSKLTTQFVALIAERRRSDDLEAIEEQYQRLLDADLGRALVQVRSAVPLTDAQRAILSRTLAPALGGRQAVFEEVVDHALLGGFVVESGSVVLDGSLEGQLERLRRHLASG